MVTLAGSEPPRRVVRTRHGDAMLLTDFLWTRLFETAVHGLDVADAAGVSPWLTPAAAHELKQVLFATPPPPGADADLLRRATGRGPTKDLAAYGPRRLALG